MGQSGPLELGVAQIAKPYRLQAGPPEPVTRGGRFDRDERVILKGSEQRPRFRRFPLHVWSLFARSTGGRWARDYTQCNREATVENRLKSAVRASCSSYYR